MNTTLRNRLIGLAIVLIVLFLLSLLIPRHQSATDVHSIPVSAIPVGSASAAAGSSASAPAAAAAENPAVGGIASAGGDGIHTQTYQAAGQAAASAAAPTDNGNAGVSAAQAASQYEMKSHSAAQPKTAQAKTAQIESTPSTKAPARHQAAAVASTPAPAASGDTYVQVGSFGDSANAQKLLTGLQHKGFHGRIDAAAIRGKTLYRVQVGPYADEDAANRAQQRLVASGYKGARVFSGS